MRLTTGLIAAALAAAVPALPGCERPETSRTTTVREPARPAPADGSLTRPPSPIESH